MITFGPVTDEGAMVSCTVKDYGREEATFDFRQLGDDESLEYYLECLMNHYWLHIGKNKRDYND